jgi:diguanylate cyclase (GGDEF)-like protein
MIPQELRKEFSVFIGLQSDEANIEMKKALMEAGYDSFIFSDQQTLIDRVKDVKPHIILFSPDALSSSLSEFVETILKENSEVQFAVIATPEMSTALFDYREYNFASLIVDGDQLSVRTVWALDQVCETLYRTYQNEKLLEKLESEPGKLPAEERTAIISGVPEPSATVPLVLTDLEEKIHLYKYAVTKEDYIEAFLKQVPGRAIYFKFLPTVGSFVSTFAQGIDLDTLKDVGVRLNFEESKDVDEFFRAGNTPEALKDLLSEGLKVEGYMTKPVFTLSGLDGLFVFWNFNAPQASRIESHFLIFQLLHQQGSLLKRLETVDTLDPVTELSNQRSFERNLELEISRAKRYESPVSVVQIRIDHLEHIRKSFGPSNRDLILKTLANLIRQTSRPTDISARTQENQISLILPHCARKGAALKAERLRRTVEAHTFPIPDLKISISCGVSEYPSLSNSGDELSSSAIKALEFIANRGGNKVCLYKPAQEIKPDFEVR